MLSGGTTLYIGNYEVTDKASVTKYYYFGAHGADAMRSEKYFKRLVLMVGAL